MGRRVMISLLTLAALLLMLLFGLVLFSHFKTPDTGIVNGKLKPCPDSPNCVCSEAYADKQPIHTIDSIKVDSGDIDDLWQLLRDAVVESGGDVVEENSGYLHAEFTTPLLRFVDDLELRLDRQQHEIHMRSASRVGRSDLGANRKRIEQIWSRLGDGK